MGTHFELLSELDAWAWGRYHAYLRLMLEMTHRDYVTRIESRMGDTITVKLPKRYESATNE